MEWTEGTIVRLRELWDEGHSTAEIGRRLGFSKNAIVGKAHRLDLSARPSPIRREIPEQEAASGSTRCDGTTLPPLASDDVKPFTPEPALLPVPLSPGPLSPVQLAIVRAVPAPAKPAAPRPVTATPPDPHSSTTPLCPDRHLLLAHW
jgi:GcrA cell cycle regulator